MEECAGNTLIVHVVSVRGLTIKGGKPVEVYCSLSTSGKGPWKSKVSTNAIRAEPSSAASTGGGGGVDLRWDERCEFQLNDTDAKLVLHVNHKTIFGTTETLGELVFQLAQMPKLQSPTWFRLNKAGSTDKERGQIQLGFQFSNTLGHRGVTSISNLSLNKIEKENKLHRLRRKMQEFGRKATGNGSGDGSTADTQSLASISIAAGHNHHHQNLTISRRSSFSSTNSGALAFSSPSPNPPTLEEEDANDDRRRSLTLVGGSDLSSKPTTTIITSETIGGYSARRGGRASNWANAIASSNQQQNVAALFISTSSETTPSSFDAPGSSHPQKRTSTVGQSNAQQQGADLLRPPSANTSEQRRLSAQQNVAGFDDGNNSLGRASSVSGRSAFSVFSAAMTAAREGAIDGGGRANEQQQKTPPPPSSHQKLRVKMRQKAEQLLQLRALTGGSSTKKQTGAEQPEMMERRDSIASSSGFVSFGSGQLGSLNEQTSPEHLLNVIRHLRKELLKKEERIRDLEEYTDHLVTKVMVANPELLAAPSPNKPGGERRQKIHQRH